MAFLTELFSRPRPSPGTRNPFPMAARAGLVDPDLSVLTIRPADFPRPPRYRAVHVG